MTNFPPEQMQQVMTALDELRAVEPKPAIIPGAADIERRYEYWIELGRRAERDRIVKELDFFWDQLTQLMAVGYSESAKQLLIQAITPRGETNG
jgi:hypothetical protein